MIYYASFVPGMQEVISSVLTERLGRSLSGDLSILKLLDGAVIFETDCTYDRLNFFCFNNIFAVIDILEQDGSTSGGANSGIANTGIVNTQALELHIKKILVQGKNHPVISENNKKITSFRLVCSMENKPAAINESSRQNIENFIARNSALKPDRSKPDTEFWFLYRREGFSVFMKRLTRHASFENSLHPGELPPPLAWLLCHIAGLKHGETVIDPFCGYGAIPEAALKHFPIKKIFASDIDTHCLKFARGKPALKNTERGAAHGAVHGAVRFKIVGADVFSILEFIGEGETDAIVTDPPWGMYRETAIPLQKFYDDIMVIFSRLLKKEGRAVILTAAGQELKNAAEKTPELHITASFPILVSGKKASVFVLKK